MSAKYQINDRFVKNAPSPEKGSKLFYSDELSGFALRTTKSGAKSFVLNYRMKGIERRITIGRYPEWSVKAAKDRAKELRREIDKGIDPLAEKQSHLSVKRMTDLFEYYRAVKFSDPLTHSDKDRRSMWNNFILAEFSKLPLEDFSLAHAMSFHRKITTNNGPIRANRVLEVLHNSFELAIQQRWVDRNPVKGWKRNPENKRERYLSEAEAQILLETLSEYDDRTTVDAILLILFTGSRKTETMKALWSEFDLERGIWTKTSHHTKNKKTHTVPLNGLAIELLKGIKARGGNYKHVFPSADGFSHIVELKQTWKTVRAICTLKVWEADNQAQKIVKTLANDLPPSKKCKHVLALAQSQNIEIQTGLLDVRIHDLRHSFASFLISKQVDLPTIGKLLGHTQIQTTMRYAHLADGALRDGTSKLDDVFSSIGTK